MLGISLSIPQVAALRAGGPTYDTDAAALMARMTYRPDLNNPTDAAKINANILAKKGTNGDWSKIDTRHVLAGADSQAARQNWKSSSYTATAFNAPAFTAYKGFTGDGVAAYLATGFDPTTAPAGLLMQQDSAHLVVWTLTAGATNGYDAGAVNNRGKVRGRPAANGATGGLSTTSVVTMAAAGSAPLCVCVVRRDGGNQILFVNGVQVATAANASAGLMSALDILRAASSYGDRLVALVQCGPALTDAEVLANYSNDNTLLQALGAF